MPILYEAPEEIVDQRARRKTKLPELGRADQEDRVQTVEQTIQPAKSVELAEVKKKISRPKKSALAKISQILPEGGKLSALIVRPEKVHFQTQEPGEEVALLLRRHWITNLRWLFTAFFMLLFPWVLKYFEMMTFLPVNFQTMAILLWCLLSIAFIFEQFLSWYFNVYIVTTKRVVDLDFYNIIYYNQSQADLDEITDMNITVSGVGRLFFNYGDLIVETAGQTPNIEFHCVPNPRKVMQIIEKLKP